MDSTRPPPIGRLGVHAWGWWNEANHGVAFLTLYPPFYLNQLVNTTTYPVDLALGSSWDPNLMYAEASQIGDEAREVAPNNFETSTSSRPRSTCPVTRAGAATRKPFPRTRC